MVSDPDAEGWLSPREKSPSGSGSFVKESIDRVKSYRNAAEADPN
jgi:hypothetical protein